MRSSYSDGLSFFGIVKLEGFFSDGILEERRYLVLYGERLRDEARSVYDIEDTGETGFSDYCIDVACREEVG